MFHVFDLLDSKVDKVSNKKILVLMNANSFTKTNKHNNSMTMYTKLTETNQNFIGKTLYYF